MFTKKKVSIGLALASVAVQCASLTIGPAQGAAWIGRPLELSIPVVNDTLSDTAALCVHADVYYAETRQDASRVHVQQEPSDQADTVRLQLRSSTPINEPVVTVNLRVGCEDKSMRRFVLLADFPVIAEVPAERALPEVVETLPMSADTEPGAARALPAGLAREGMTTAAARSATPRTTVAKVKPSTRAAKPARPQRARLQLDSVDILLERIKTLEAAATAPPVEPVNKDSERLQRLESDLQSLREQTAKNGATLLVLQKQLERAESERISTEWFYGLVATLMLCAGAIVMLWQRRRVPQSWDEGPSVEPDSEPEPYEAQFLRKTAGLELFEAPPLQTPFPRAKFNPDPEPEPKLEVVDLPVDVNLVEFDEPQWSAANKTPTARP